MHCLIFTLEEKLMGACMQVTRNRRSHQNELKSVCWKPDCCLMKLYTFKEIFLKLIIVTTLLAALFKFFPSRVYVYNIS